MTINIDNILRQINQRIDENMRTPARMTDRATTERLDLMTWLNATLATTGVDATLINVDDQIDMHPLTGEEEWTPEVALDDNNNNLAEAVFMGGVTDTEREILRGEQIRGFDGQGLTEPRRTIPLEIGPTVRFTNENAAIPIGDETVRTFDNGPRTGRVAGLNPAGFIPTETIRANFFENPWTRTGPEPGMFRPTAADLQHRTYTNPEAYRTIDLGDTSSRRYRPPETLINIPVEEYNELLECKRWKEIANSYGVMSAESLFDVLGSVR